MKTKRRARSRRAPDTEAVLHGNAPDHSPVVLLLVDVINDLEFPGGDQLARHARPLGRKLAALKARARRAGVACVYANDNFGRWRSDFSAQVRHCLEDGVRGELLVQALVPGEEDYFVLKPKHSAFYQTCLETLLTHLGAQTLMIAGMATDNCVVFSAGDAYLRGHKIVILEDACAAISEQAHRQALAHMTRVLKARRARCSDVTFLRGASGLRLRIKKR